MSFPPLTGYGNYCDSNSNQNAPTSYGSARRSRGSGYQQYQQQDDRQSQYGSSGYDWQGANQPAYPNPQESYSNESWRDANGQPGQYEYIREASDYATQAAAGNSAQGYYGSSTSQPMQGLNNLTYASGLDNPRESSSRAPQQARSTRYSTTPNTGIKRTQSPLQSNQQPQYSTVQSTTYSAHDRTPTGTSSPQLAISAAQALAGAVSRKFQQSGGTQKTTSPAISNASSVQRTSSPYSASTTTQSHARKSSGQSQASHAHQTSRITSPSQVHKQAAPTVQTQSSQQNKGPTPAQRSAASQANSISNLVSTTQESQTSSAMATDSMPAFIDPTQVFNPYHKEHERRRREATEAEIRRQEQEAAAAKAQEEHKRKEAEAEAVKTVKQTPNKPPDSDAALKATSPVEDAMALEMKMMMEKMKEFRSRDPSLFQKLWEDTRKGGSGGTASVSANAIASNSATPAASTSPQVPQQNDLAGPSEQSATPASTKVRKRLPKSQQPPSAASRMNLPGNPQANGWKVVVEDNDDNLPDLGRYPAERHIRGSYQPKRPTPATQMPSPSAGSYSTPGLDDGPLPNQPLPARTASGGVEWPKDKRDALAASAIQALSANLENEKVGITPADIHTMLEQNPSYIQLCDLLEKRGLRFHRGQFARQLLSSVPDLTTPSKGKETPHPQPTSTPVSQPTQHQQQPAPHSEPPRLQQRPQPAAHTPTQPSPGPGSQLPPSMAPNGFVPSHPPPQMPPNGFVPGVPVRFVQGPSPFQHVSYPYIPSGIQPEHRVFPDQKPPKPKRGLTVPSRPEPPPGSKEAMARKRDFSDLVDLTQLSDNDDYVLSSKHPRLESPSPEPDPFEAYRIQQNLQADTVAPGSLMSNPIGLPDRAPLKFNTMQPARAAALAPLPPPQKPRTILARSVDKKEALRKSYYDPKTVARDILIAAGRHPSERPLNAHMAGLLGVHVDLDSDLSTFDWDAIDPGGPSAPKVEYVDIPAAPPRFKIGDLVRRPGPKPRAEAESEPRSADSGKREMQEPTSPAPKGPSLGKFKSPVTRTASDQVKARSELKSSKLRQSQAVNGETSSERAVTPQKQKPHFDSSPRERSLRSTSRHERQSMDTENMSSSGMYPSGKKRGRPFGSKNKHPSLTTMKKAARPQPLVEIPARPSSPQGNPIFKCRWRQCHAELHNLDTLRKHIARKHHPTEEELNDHGYICWWKKCRYLIQDGGEISVEHDFDSAEDWMDHINEDHLHKIALKLGDGPSAAQIGKHTSTSLDVFKYFYDPISPKAGARTSSYTDPQSLAQGKALYLSDPQGRATTPSVSEKRTPDLPLDTLLLTKAKGDNANSDMAAQKSFLKVHHRDQKIGAKMNAEEVLRAMEKRKRDIGPGIDRGGCTLVNEARRSTFVQSPGIRRVVDADY